MSTKPTMRKYNVPNRLVILVTFSMAAMIARAVDAHFLWLLPPTEGQPQVRLVFSESPEPDDPDLLDRLGGITLTMKGRDTTIVVPMKKEGDALIASVDHEVSKSTAVFSLRHTYGVMERNGVAFKLEYQAATVRQFAEETRTGSEQESGLTMAIKRHGSSVDVQLLLNNSPVSQGKLSMYADGQKQVLNLKPDGTASIEQVPSVGFALLASTTEDQSGVWEGKAYSEIRYYSTVVVGSEPQSEVMLPLAPTTLASLQVPDLPESITSFGAAAMGPIVFVAGGHTGESHSYSISEQSNQLLIADLPNATAWKVSEMSDRIQGLGMVATKKGVVRLGGFTARNAYGEKQQLESLATVTCYDLKTGTWQSMPPLPEARSSHDAALLENYVYVVGGWEMSPEQPTRWHDTAWRLNLDAAEPEWEPISAPNFRRRALATVGYRGKLYVLGGMNESSGPTCETEIYDPTQKTWSHGPALIGAPLAGFGAAACVYQDRLYVSTVEGKLLRLTENGSEWEIAGTTPSKRFFHRLVPTEFGIMVLGGSNPDGDRPTKVELLLP